MNNRKQQAQGGETPLCRAMPETLFVTAGLVAFPRPNPRREERVRYVRASSLLDAAPALYEAMREFCTFYQAKEHHLGNGQARRSLDRFRAALALVDDLQPIDAAIKEAEDESGVSAMSVEGETTELKITKVDIDALGRAPGGWFQWFEMGHMVRCPEFRLKRLVERGLIERKLIGHYPNCHWLYRVTEKGKGINDH